jgi:hypothetical protein
VKANIATLLRRAAGVVLPAGLGAIVCLSIADAMPAGAVSEQPFLAANDSAMNTMMTDMTIRPTGNVDRDFVGMMAPHHQGAIDMAIAYLRFGHNERLRRLAQEIIVTQQEEIAAMRRAIGEKLPPSAPAPTQISSAAQSHGAMPKSNH